MQIELSPQHIQTILFEAQAAAKRLHWRLGPASPGQEDLCQDLLIDLLRRLPAFDPKRGSLWPFPDLSCATRPRASRCGP
jgi:RNA polymerase sigma-70 factor (ECF subfamily)